jgi:D-aspartate ligase
VSLGTSDTPTAVVVEVAWVNGLGAIRALGRHGIGVVAVDHRPWALGFSSRYVAQRVVAPDPVADEDGFVEAMAALGEGLDRPVPVFPTHDEHLNSFVRRAAELGPWFRVPAPGW